MPTRKAVLTTMDRTASKILRLRSDVKALKPHPDIASAARLIRMEAEDLGKLAPVEKPKQCEKCDGRFDPTTLAGAEHFASCRVYNGWKNYETWAIKLWIDDNQGRQSGFLALAAEAQRRAIREAKTIYLIPPERRAGYLLSQLLKETIRDQNDPDDSEILTTMYRAAMDEVDWREIAEALLEGLPDPFAAISTLPRDRCVELLEGAGIGCQDDEDVAKLREAVHSNVADGTIGFEDVIGNE